MPRYPGSSWRSYRPNEAGGGASARTASGAGALSPAAPCRILGLDPGSLRTGYGLIDCSGNGERHVANGCINLRGEDFIRRLRRIFEAVAELIEQHRPHEIAIERVFVHRNVDSALKLGQARGAAICAAVTLGASAHEYAPRAIKLAVSGFGGADKLQVARMVTTLLNLERRPVADAADALAIALCHAQRRRLDALRNAAQSQDPGPRRTTRIGGRAGLRP
jgi:crossover junction endodeoxyribonuclease RuvC